MNSLKRSLKKFPWESLFRGLIAIPLLWFVTVFVLGRIVIKVWWQAKTGKVWLARVMSVALIAIVMGFAFPFIPGITLSAGPVGVVGLGVSEYFLSLGSVIVCLATAVTCIFLAGMLLDRYPDDKDSDAFLLRLGERLGYYKVMGLLLALSCVSDVMALKLIGWWFPGLTIAGFLPAVGAALVLNLACLIPFLLRRKDGKYSKKAFEEELAKLRAQVEAAKSKKAAAPAAPAFFVDDSPSGGPVKWNFSTTGTAGRVSGGGSAIHDVMSDDHAAAEQPMPSGDPTKPGSGDGSHDGPAASVFGGSADANADLEAEWSQQHHAGASASAGSTGDSAAGQHPATSGDPTKTGSGEGSH